MDAFGWSFWIALGIAVLGALVCAVVYKKWSQYAGFAATGVIWIALTVLRLPIVTEELPIWEHVVLSALDGLRFFTLEQRHEPLPVEVISDWKDWYSSLEIILSAAAVVCTATFLLSVLRWFGKVKLLCIWRPVYYFSELNEKSYVLADNIYQQWKDRVDQNLWQWWDKPILVFCKESVSEEGEVPGLRKKVRDMGAVFYPDPIDVINKARPWWRTVKVFLMDTDENANMSAALKMKDWIARKKGGHLPWISVDSDLLVFSTEESGEFLFDKLLSTVKKTRVTELEKDVSDQDIADTLMCEAMKKLQQQEEEARNKEKNTVPETQEPVQEKKSLLDPKTQQQIDTLVDRLMAKILSYKPDNDAPRHREILKGRLKGTALRVVKKTAKPDETPEVKLFENAWEMLREEVATGRFDREDSSIDLHLVNETKFIAQKLLWEHPLYQAERDCKISLLIVGGGRLGMEILRAAMVCGTMYHCKLETVVVDLQAQRLEKQFQHEYPYLKNYLKESVMFCPADVTTTEFDGVLKQHCVDCRYIVVATGDDERNMITAQFLRRWYARYEIGKDSREFGQQIYVAVRSSERHETLSALGEENTTLFGCNTQMFSPEELLDRHVDRMAMWYNLCYKDGLRSGKLFPNPKIGGKDLNVLKQEEQNQDKQRKLLKLQQKLEMENKREAKRVYCRLVSTNQRSNQLLALHCLYKLCDLRKFAGLSESDDTLRQLTGMIHSLSKNGNQMFELEHERWEVFQYINGWGPFSIEQIKDGINGDIHQDGHKHSIAKLHGCLLSFDKLDDLAKEIGKRDFRLHDKAMCVASLLVWLKEVRLPELQRGIAEVTGLLSKKEKRTAAVQEDLEQRQKLLQQEQANTVYAIETIRSIPYSDEVEMTGEVFLHCLCNKFPQ